ncbi:MAG: DNA methyltransferase [Methylococcaceae bacterium]
MIDIDALRARADWFSKEFTDANYEMGQAQNFMRGLCDVYGISPYRAAIFEDRVAKDGGGINRIDGLFPGLLLVEMKSKGKSLEKAYEQTKGYVEKLKKRPDALPRYVLVSDFQNLVLYDQESNTPDTPVADFKLADFQQNVEVLGFLSGYEREAILQQEAANIAAAKKLGELHDAIKDTGYAGDDLERLLVRILFCLFGDDTNLFGESDLFFEIISQTRADGHDLDCALNKCFGVLDMPFDSRPKSLYPEFQVLPYVNGALFKGRLADHCFSSDARTALLECCKIDWSEISPAIFGTLFQTIMHYEDEDSHDKATGKPKKRREFGAHYTSEENILKVISPLFLDALKAELKKAHDDKKKLNAFHAKLRQLEFFDPACGCGNFLVIAYREIRLLEADTLQRLELLTRQQREPICDVDQFYGIEIDSTSAQIAVVAMWITDHQMNRQISNNGKPYLRLPLNHRANIVCANALQIDWQTVINPKECSFIMGNPPFIGKKEQSPEQKNDIQSLASSIKGSGVLDYVTGWYLKATAFIKKNPKIPVAFVSTNSICQGEQVGILWAYLSEQGVKIHFAHRTFRWNNEAGNVAAVHCVIIGFGLKEPASYRLFDYIHTKVEDRKTKKISTVTKIKEIKAKQINPYLVDAPIVHLERRANPLSNVSAMNYGSMPIDNGHLILSEAEKNQLLSESTSNQQFVFEYMGGDEFINNEKRWCLWLENGEPEAIKNSAFIMARVQQVKDFRNSSGREATQKLANSPTLFGERRQPKTDYLLLPKVSSENREYMPIGFIEPSVIANGSALIVPEATKYHFGVLQSKMHMAWMRTVCGRMKSDYQYSASIVYNNFPFPVDVKPAAKKKIEDAAQAVLEARAVHKDKSLADLYNPKTMPENLANAHVELDKAVDTAYVYGRSKKDDASRVAFLFVKYQELIAPVVEVEAGKKKNPKLSGTQL